MSIFDVLDRLGTAALLRFTAAVVLFLTIHLVRVPFVLVARVLEFSLRRLDRYVTTAASRPPQRPVNRFFADTTAREKEATNVYA